MNTRDFPPGGGRRSNFPYVRARPNSLLKRAFRLKLVSWPLLRRKPIEHARKCVCVCVCRNQWSLIDDNYLDGHRVDPVPLDAQLEGVDPHEPVGTWIDPRHDAYQSVIPIEERSRDTGPLSLRHRWSGEGVQTARRVTVSVHSVRSSRLHVQPHPARQPLP